MSANALVVGVGADISSIPTTLSDAEKLFTNFAQTVTNDIKSSFGNMFKDAKLAESLGSSTEQLRELKYVSELTGTSFSALTNSMSFFERNVGKALEETTTKAKNFHASLHTSTHLGNVMTESFDGTANALKKFTALGLDPKSLASMGSAAAIKEVAIAVEKLGSTAQRNAAYSDILGRGFKGAIPALQELGRAGNNSAEELRKLSGEFTQVDYSHIELAKEAMTKLETVYDSFIKQISVHLSPVITVATNWLIEMGITGENSGEIIGNAFTTALSWAESFVSFAMTIPELLSSIWEQIKEDAPSTFGAIGTAIKDTLFSAIDSVSTYMTKKFDETFKGSALFNAYEEIKKTASTIKEGVDSIPSMGPSYFGENGPIGLMQKAAGMLGEFSHQFEYAAGDKFGITDRVYKNSLYMPLGKKPYETPMRGPPTDDPQFASRKNENTSSVEAWTDDVLEPMVEVAEKIKSPMEKLTDTLAKFKEDWEAQRQKIKADWEARLSKEKSDAEARSVKRKQEVSEMKMANQSTSPLGFGGRIDQYGGSISAITSSLQRAGSNVQEVRDVQGNKLLQGIYEKSNMVARIGK